MEEPGHGIVGREHELARVRSFLGSVLDVPSARVLAFVVRRLEDAPIRILVALRVGSGGDPLGLGRTGPVPLQRVPVGPLSEQAMTRLLRDRTKGGLPRPILLRLHRISEGNPLFTTHDQRVSPILHRSTGPSLLPRTGPIARSEDQGGSTSATGPD